MEYKNDLERVAQVATRAVLHAKYHDTDGKVKDILGTGDGNGLDLDEFRKEFIPSISDTNPSVGADVYPGSLANGEITGRYLLNDTVTDPTKVTNLTFKQDVGAKMNMVGDGLEFHGYLLKTTITNGVKGSSVKIPIFYDPKNALKEGYYVTTSPYLIHIKADSFTVGTPVKIVFDGIGEGNTGENHLSASVEFTFNADKTMDVKAVQGYDNDGASSGVNGFTYDYVNELVSTYSTQPAVQQLPDTINFFTGSSNGTIALAGATDFFENSSSGIEITFNDYLVSPTTLGDVRGARARIALSTIGLKNTLRISKSKLIIDNAIDLAPKAFDTNDRVEVETQYGGKGDWFLNKTGITMFTSYGTSLISIKNGSLNIDLKVTLNDGPSYGHRNTYPLVVNKIKPYID